MTFMLSSVTPWSVRNQRPVKNQPAIPKNPKNAKSNHLRYFGFTFCENENIVMIIETMLAPQMD